MRSFLFLASAFALPTTAFATDHGSVFGYATPVNSQGEISCETGIHGHNAAALISRVYLRWKVIAAAVSNVRMDRAMRPCSPINLPRCSGAIVTVAVEDSPSKVMLTVTTLSLGKSE